jgi:predicted nuclease of predicted toxin-antitoxin system
LARFLIDANLPNRFALWNGPNFELVVNHDDAWPDSVVWDYARSHDLTIVTKDADFSDRIMYSDPPPRVIHLRIGNMRLAELRAFLMHAWPQLDELSTRHKLLIVHASHIECVS